MASERIPSLYTASEAAFMLGYSRQWIDKLVRDGRLVPTREQPRLFTLVALRDAMRKVNEVGNPNWTPQAPLANIS